MIRKKKTNQRKIKKLQIYHYANTCTETKSIKKIKATTKDESSEDEEEVQVKKEAKADTKR